MNINSPSELLSTWYEPVIAIALTCLVIWIWRNKIRNKSDVLKNAKPISNQQSNNNNECHADDVPNILLNQSGKTISRENNQKQGEPFVWLTIT
jgi:hypothetical protein